MRPLLACVVLLSAFLAVSQAADEATDGRSWFFTTFTLITGTSTSTSSTTTVVTCTTSTSALTTCTGGRRRRGLFYDEDTKHRRGLFYNDQELENNDGSVHIAKRFAKDEEKPVEKAQEKPSVVVGLEVQSGYNLPEGFNNNRFGLAFGQATVVSTSLLTSTSTITASCASTTGFPTCVNTGK